METERTPVFKPMPGRVAVRLQEEERVGSLYLPPNSQRSRVMGTVIAIGGDEEEGEEWDLRIGDEVLFGQNSGIKVTVDRKEVLILRTSEILCRLEWKGEKGTVRGEYEGDPSEVL